MPSNQLENPTNNPLIDSYNQLITEKIPGLPVPVSNIPPVDLSLGIFSPGLLDQGPTNQYGRTQAEQDAVNASIEQGNFVGYGQDDDGNFAGVVTNTNTNTGVMSNVTTGFNSNTANINNPAAVSAIQNNASKGNNGGPTGPGGGIGGEGQRSGPAGARS
jgi:hypothetical protein